MSIDLRSKLYEPLRLPAILLVVVFAASRLMQPRLQEMAAPVMAQRDALRAAKERLAAIDPSMAQRLRAKLQSEREAIAAIELTIPATENLPGLMQRVQERASALQLRMGDLEPLAASPLAAQGTAPYAATAYAVSVRGRWAPLNTMLADLAHQGEFVVPVVESVKADSAGTVLEARLVVTLVGKSAPVLGQVLAAPTPATPTPPATPGAH